MSSDRTALLFSIAAACLAGSCATAPPGPQAVVQVHRLEVVDDSGKVTAVLEGSSLLLMDAKEMPVLRLEVTEGGPTLVMLDGQGKPKADLSVSMSSPSLMLGDLDSNEPQLQASVSSTGSGLWLRDMTGRTQAEISVTPHGTSLTMRESGTESEVALGLGGLTKGEAEEGDEGR